jgi:large subunit ribosomal protein L20
MLTAAKGFRLKRSKLYRYASDAVDHGRQYAYRDRRAKKRTFRYLWQIRINASAREAGLTYSRFMEGLKAAKIALDRKIIADLAATDTSAFGELVTIAKKSPRTRLRTSPPPLWPRPKPGSSDQTFAGGLQSRPFYFTCKYSSSGRSGSAGPDPHPRYGSSFQHLNSELCLLTSVFAGYVAILPVSLAVSLSEKKLIASAHFWCIFHAPFVCNKDDDSTGIESSRTVEHSGISP